MTIKTLPLSSNCYIVSDDDGKTVVFDVCERGREIYEYIQGLGLDVVCVVITHGHFDHIYGLSEFMRSAENDKKDIPIYIHSGDVSMMRSREKNLSAPLFRTPYEYTGILNEVENGDVITVGKLNFRVLHTPGHTDGCACYIEDNEKTIFSGDVLFEGSIGRTDFPGGDMGTMRKSLIKLMEFEDCFRVYPGHGSSTTIGDERNFNPFVAQLGL